MIIGYREKINKIVVYCNNDTKFTRTLAIYGLNDLGSCYTYYNKKDGQLHILDKEYITKIKMYHDNEFVMEI